MPDRQGSMSSLTPGAGPRGIAPIYTQYVFRGGVVLTNRKVRVICSSAPENVRERAYRLAENVLWMEVKLAEARAMIGDSSLVVGYDNGGGQKGIRRNPAFDAYNALLSSYTKALKQLCVMVGVQEEDDGDSDLDAIIARAQPTRPSKPH